MNTHDPSPTDGWSDETLDAVERAVCAPEGDLASALGAIGDPVARSFAVAARRDRALLASVRGVRAPAGLMQGAIDRALADDFFDADELAAMEAGAAPRIEGLPVSRIEPYREPVVARLWRHRREAGLMAAAVLVFVSGMAIVAGVRALGPAARSALWGSDGGPEVADAGDGRTDEAGPVGGGDAIARADGSGGVGGSEGSRPAAASGPAAPVAMGDWLARTEPGGTPGVIADEFAAAPLLGSGRVVAYVRSGSARATAATMASLGEREIGLDHSFAVRGAVGSEAVAGIGIPAPSVPVLASEDGPGADPVLATRGGWVAEVRRTPAALAALRKTLESAGMTVEFRVLDEGVSLAGVSPERGGVDREADGGDKGESSDAPSWWSGPASAWRRTAALPVLVDSLPDR